MGLSRFGIAMVSLAFGFVCGGLSVYEYERGHQLPQIVTTDGHLKVVAPSSARLGVWFSPKGGCTQQVVTEIDNAKTSLHCQAYSFTSKPIAQAILQAKSRGVKIVVVLDKSDLTERGSDLSFFDDNGIETWIDDKHAIAHSKIMIFDNATILTGSFNFTTAAENSNAENMLVIRGDPELVAQYEANFQKHLAHSYRH